MKALNRQLVMTLFEELGKHEHVATVVRKAELLLEELGEGLAVLLVSGWVDITQAGLCRSLKDVEKDRVIDVQ